MQAAHAASRPRDEFHCIRMGGYDNYFMIIILLRGGGGAITFTDDD